MLVPKAIFNLVNAFERLPGIGPKTAQRLTFYLLHVPQPMLDDFALALTNLKKQTVLCSICHNVAESDPCPICSSQNRDHTMICVIEQPLEVLAMERSGWYKGVYHVLHGAISPLNNIGPDELKIRELLERIKRSEGNLKEIILATNSNMEGEATAMYIAREISRLKSEMPRLKGVGVTRLGQGLPTGADLEYADDLTLQRAMEGRREIQ